MKKKTVEDLNKSKRIANFKLFATIYLSLCLVFIWSGCDGNILTKDVNSSIGDSFDNDGDLRFSFVGSYPTINTSNASSYQINGLCEPSEGDVTVTVQSPTLSQVFLCNSNGRFSDSMDLTSITSSPAGISAVQGSISASNRPSPVNDQTPISNAPTVANQPLQNGANSTVPVTCNEVGEVLSFTGVGLSPSPQTYTCSSLSLVNVTLSFSSSTETSLSNSITVSSVDTNGNITINDSSFILPIDNILPQVAVIAGADVPLGQDAFFTITVTDANITSLNYRYTVSSGSALPAVCTSNPCNVTVSGASSGALTLTVGGGSVTDDAGNLGPVSGVSDSLIVAGDPVPTITAVSVTSSDGDGDSWYEAADTIILAVQFSEPVFVASGTPSISVSLTNGTKLANYNSGSGGNILNFNLPITNGDSQCDGNILLNSLVLNGATIRDNLGQDSINTGLAASVSGVAVDAIAPIISGSISTSANNAIATASAVTASWASQSDNCSVSTIEMAIGNYSGGSCSAPVAITNFVQIGNLNNYQPVSGVSPFIGPNLFSLNTSSNYCTSVQVTDGAGNTTISSSNSWQATNLEPPTGITHISNHNNISTSPSISWTLSAGSNVSVQHIGLSTNVAGGDDLGGFNSLSNTATGYTFNGLTLPECTNIYATVYAEDVASNVSAYGVSATPFQVDVTNPTVPSGLSLSGIPTLVRPPLLNFTASTDNCILASYEVAIGTTNSGAGINNVMDWLDIGAPIGSYNIENGVDGASFSLNYGQDYYISIRAKDSFGLVSSAATSTVWHVGITALSDVIGYSDGTHNCYISSTTFDCVVDNSTDGGGWLLVGRGREDWDWTDAGKGAPGDVAIDLPGGGGGVPGTVGSTTFTPTYWAASFINDLLASDSLAVNNIEVRIKRAFSATGLTYQDFRWFINRTTWSWVFDSGFSFYQNSTLNGVDQGTCPTTRDNICNGNNANRLWTYAWGGNNNLKGFTQGYNTGNWGSPTDPNNFGWQRTTTNQHTVPYTEVYIRTLP